MAVLPTDLLTNIFMRLPATTLATSVRRVCSSWRAVVSDPTFISNHLQISNDDDTPLLFHKNSQIYGDRTFMLSSNDNRLSFTGPVDILDETCTTTRLACNGLLLDVREEEGKINLYLYNPLLKHCVSLEPIVPETFGYKSSATPIFKELGFGYMSWGFGYDPITKCYKVFAITEVSQIFYLTIEVQNSPENRSNSSWRFLDIAKDSVFVDNRCNGVFLNERLHWVNCQSEFGQEIEKGYILTINLNTDEVNSFSFRIPSYSYLSGFKRLGVLGERNLCLFINMSEQSTCKVLILEDYDDMNSWTEHSSLKNLNGCLHEIFHWRNSEFIIKRNSYQVINKDTMEIDELFTDAGSWKFSFISKFLPCIVPLI